MDLIKRAGLSILGVALTLAWWTFRGEGDDDTTRLNAMPEVVWEGGATITIDASCSEPGKLHVSFGRRVPEGDDGTEQQIDVDIPLQAGEYTYTVKVPNGVHGYVELGIEKPSVGAEAAVHVQVNGAVAAEDEATLEEPLKDGYAFFAQVHMQDYAAGEAD